MAEQSAQSMPGMLPANLVETGGPPATAGTGFAGNRTLLTLGRVIFGGYALCNGINHLMNRRSLAEYAETKRVPMPDAAVVGSGLFLLVGGLSILTGARPKVGAALISTFLAGVSPVMHDFWAIEDDCTRTQELVNFSKNMALIGAACLAAAVPEPWPASLQLGPRRGRSGPAAVAGPQLT